MAPTSLNSKSFLAKRGRTADRGGFSLIEVAIATGLCTYALLVIASLMPVGIGAIQIATQQTEETQIFNEMWSEFNTTPFDSLGGNSSSTQTSLINSGTTNPFWFDVNGQQLTSSAGAIYYVRCTLVNSNNSSSAAATVPPVDGGTATVGSSACLNFAEIQIGYHVDPQTVASTDPRVVTRNFLLVKRDGL